MTLQEYFEEKFKNLGDALIDGIRTLKTASRADTLVKQIKNIRAEDFRTNDEILASITAKLEALRAQRYAYALA